MFKKFMSFFVSVCMFLAFMPIKAHALEEYPLFVGNQQVTSENLSGTGWSYQGDASAGTLTLENANISSISSSSSGFDLTINLVGESTVSQRIYFSNTSTSSVTIEGEGTLNAINGMSGTTNLTITGDCTVNAITEEAGVPSISVANLTISGNSSVNATSNSSAIITAPGTLTIKDNSSVNASGGVGLNVQGYMNNFNSTGLTITDNSTVIANGTAQGIFIADTNLTISENSSVTVSGSSCGIYLRELASGYTATIKDNSSLTTTATSSATGSYSDLGSCGIAGTANLTFSDNALVTAQGVDYAIHVRKEEESSGIILEENGPQILEPTGGYIKTENYNNSNYDSIICNSDGTTATRAVIGKNFDISVQASPTPGGTVSGGDTYLSTTDVTVTATPSTGYHFVNWTENGAQVSTDSSYSFKADKNRDLTANFELETYTIKFVNDDGTELQSSSVAYGSTPNYTGATPTKAATAQYTYTFNGWSPAITSVTGDKTYTATYSSTINEYTIKFVNDDGTELQSGSLAYGTTPTYTGETPVKASDAQYTYSFAGWDPAITSVTGDKTYTATYNSTVNEYTITFRNEDGTELQSGSVAYGTTPEYTGETPTKESDDQYTYTFAGWDPEIAIVTENKTYTAKFNSEARTDNSESEGDPDDVTPIDGDDEEDPGYYDDNEDPTYYDDGENPTEAETSLAESPAEAENKESVASDGTMYAPITGDETNFILWVVLIAISIFWLTFVMVFRNKHSLILKTMSGGPR